MLSWYIMRILHIWMRILHIWIILYMLSWCTPCMFCLLNFKSALGCLQEFMEMIDSWVQWGKLICAWQKTRQPSSVSEAFWHQSDGFKLRADNLCHCKLLLTFFCKVRNRQLHQTISECFHFSTGEIQQSWPKSLATQQGHSTGRDQTSNQAITSLALLPTAPHFPCMAWPSTSPMQPQLQPSWVSKFFEEACKAHKSAHTSEAFFCVILSSSEPHRSADCPVVGMAFCFDKMREESEASWNT